MFIPNVGTIYEFEFLPEYTFFNGVYVVLKRMTLNECKGEGIDLLSTWYGPAGVPTAQYTADYDSLKNTDILKLRDPATNDSSKAIYVPIIYIGKVPDHTVRKYKQVSIGCNLGLIDADSSRVPTALEVMNEHMVAAIGIDIDPKLFTIKDTYLTIAQYNELESQRDENQLKVMNYFTENIKLRLENSKLRTKLRYYEEKIKHVSKKEG